jgi:two-component system, NarL family, sensor histidine kinase UhpB
MKKLSFRKHCLHHLLVCSALLLCVSTILFAFNPIAKNNHNSNRQEIFNHIGKMFIQMDKSDYDSAYTLLLDCKQQIEQSDIDSARYHLYAFEAEIFYFNALFNEGLSSAYESLQIAEKMNAPLFIASSRNLIGLLQFNLGRYTEAKINLLDAVQKLPMMHGDSNLSYRFHAASNLSELYLQQQKTDSAIYYSAVSMYEAKRMNKVRPIAINYWNMAKAYTINRQFAASFQMIDSGKYYIGLKRGNDDLLMHFSILLLENYIGMNNQSATKALISHALELMNTNAELTTYSKMEFLKSAIPQLVKENNAELLSKARILYEQMTNERNNWRNEVQLEMLQKAYINKKRLIESEYLRTQSETENKFNKLIAYLLLALLVLSAIIIYVVVQNYLSKQRSKTAALVQQKELEKLASANNERTRIAKELHDDLGSTVSSISLLTQMALQQQEKFGKTPKVLLQRVESNASQLAETMSDIIWAVYSKNDNFSNLFQRMRNFAFELLEPLNVQLTFDLDEQLLALELKVEQRKNIYYIFKEALNNAVKHSGCNKISINLQYRHPHIMLTISDNGKGFDDNEVIRNNGLHNMQQRAEIVNGTLHINSSASSGTAITLQCIY